MNFKLSSRDVKFFLLGVFSLFALDVVIDWEDNVESFKQAMRDAGVVEVKELKD